MSPADGERRLNSAIAPKPGAARASANFTCLLSTRPVSDTGRVWNGRGCGLPLRQTEDVRVPHRHGPVSDTGHDWARLVSLGDLGPREPDELVESLRGCAGVDRLARQCEALAEVRGVAGRGDSARRIENHRRAVAAVGAREDGSQRCCVDLRGAAAQLLGVAALDAELAGDEL